MLRSQVPSFTLRAHARRTGLVYVDEPSAWGCSAPPKYIRGWVTATWKTASLSGVARAE
jgi:hypothetical protein